MGKKTRTRNRRNQGFRQELKRKPPRPVLHPFRFVAMEGDALGMESIRILEANGYSVAINALSANDGEYTPVFFVTSPVSQRNCTRLAVYASHWQSLKRGPFVVFLKKRETKDFAVAVLTAAERYSAWNIARGQMAPFSTGFTSLPEVKQNMFLSWRRAVGDAAGMPARETNVIIERLRAAVSDKTLRESRRGLIDVS